MRQLLVFIKKEIRHILRDPRTLLLLVAMPIVQLLLFGFAISTEIRHTDFAVYDPSRDSESRAFIEKLDQSKYFDLHSFLNSPSQIDETLSGQGIPLVIVFPPKFAESLANNENAQIQLIVDGTDPNTATQIVNYAQSIIQGALDVQGEMQPLVTPVSRLLYNPSMKGAYHFVPGVLGMILMLICAMMTSIAIVREKERGNMELLLVSPMPPLLILLSKIIPYFLLSMLDFLLVIGMIVITLGLGVARLAYGLIPAGSLGLIYLFAMLYILAISGFGLIISNTSATMQQAMFVMYFFMLLFILLSGLFTPISSMPDAIQAVTRVNPLSYFITAMRAIYLKGSTLSHLKPNLLALALFALVFDGIAVLTYRKSA